MGMNDNEWTGKLFVPSATSAALPQALDMYPTSSTSHSDAFHLAVVAVMAQICFVCYTNDGCSMQPLPKVTRQERRAL
jgi:hypothetical protein